MNVNKGFYRFHNTGHLQEVVCKKGYIEGEIGERSKTDDEPEERIYFSEGLTGVYKIASKMVLDLIYRKRGYDKRQEEINQKARNKEEQTAMLLALEKELKSIHLDETEKEVIFAEFKNFYRNQTYMVVDLQAGEDFSPEDNWSPANMHTRAGVEIPQEKIKIIGVLKGEELKTDGFEVLKNIYANYRDTEDFGENIGTSYYIALLDEIMQKETSEQDKGQDLKIMSLNQYKQMKERTERNQKEGEEK